MAMLTAAVPTTGHSHLRAPRAPRAILPSARVVSFLFGVALAATACGSSITPSPAVRSSSSSSQTIASNTATAFTSRQFVPRISFLVPDTLTVGADQQDIVFLNGGDTGEVNIMQVHIVLDPLTAMKTAAPSDIVAWIHNHPDVQARAPVSFSAGQLRGVSIDFAVSKPPPAGSPLSCRDIGCLALFEFPGGTVAVKEGQRARIVVTQVAGVNVTIEMDAPAPGFDAFATRVQAVLSTLTAH